MIRHRSVLDGPPQDSSQDTMLLVLSASAPQVGIALRRYVESIGLRLCDVTQDPERWERAIFLFSGTSDLLHYRDGNGRFTFMSDLEMPSDERQVNQEFADVFTQHGALSGAYVAYEAARDLFTVSTYDEGNRVLFWVDSPRYHPEEPVSPEELGLSAFGFVEETDRATGQKRLFPSLDYMSKVLGRTIEPNDDLARHAFIHSLLATYGVTSLPNLQNHEVSFAYLVDE